MKFFKNAKSHVPSASECKDRYLRPVLAFHQAKQTGLMDLTTAAEAFEEEYQATLQSGIFVNDITLKGRSNNQYLFSAVTGENFKAVNLATNSYNDLDQVTECRVKLAEYIKGEEISSCLSRKIAGNTPIHKAYENALKSFMAYDHCLLATSGYIAQQAALFGLFSRQDVVFSDELNHSSIIDGLKLSGAKVIVYPHLDYIRLEELLQEHRSNYSCAGIVSDGVFSAHGTMADLNAIGRLKRKYKCLSFIDDTHGFTVLGRGRGCVDLFEEKPDVVTASLAKGLASFGGAIWCQNQAIARVIDCIGRQNINTSHLSPLVAAQGLYNLQHYCANQVQLSSELFRKVHFLNRCLKKFNKHQFENEAIYSHPIFSFSSPSETAATDCVKKLMANGLLVAFFPPPVAPEFTLRVSLHRELDEFSLKKLAQIIGESELQPCAKPYWNKMEWGQEPMETPLSFEEFLINAPEGAITHN